MSMLCMVHAAPTSLVPPCYWLPVRIHVPVSPDKSLPLFWKDWKVAQHNTFKLKSASSGSNSAFLPPTCMKSSATPWRFVLRVAFCQPLSRPQLCWWSTVFRLTSDLHCPLSGLIFHKTQFWRDNTTDTCFVPFILLPEPKKASCCPNRAARVLAIGKKVGVYQHGMNYFPQGWGPEHATSYQQCRYGLPGGMPKDSELVLVYPHTELSPLFLPYLLAFLTYSFCTAFHMLFFLCWEIFVLSYFL